jgi:uncharacterized protein (DUF488 family)
MSLPDIYTIGVYGFSESDFFQKLIENNIDTFCDIRRRRAVRGSLYAFVNSKRLQNKLAQLSIKYIYEIGLAPTNEIRELQKKVDEENKIFKRQREELGYVFKTEYIDKILSQFNTHQFINNLLDSGSRRIILFCVEKSPAACHRSLVTNKIKELYPEILITHL